MYLTKLTRINDARSDRVEEWHFAEPVTTLYPADGGTAFLAALRFVLGVTGTSVGGVHLQGQLARECQPVQEIDLLHLATMAQCETGSQRQAMRGEDPNLGSGPALDSPDLTRGFSLDSAGRFPGEAQSASAEVDATIASANEGGDVVLTRSAPAQTATQPTWRVSTHATGGHTEVGSPATGTSDSAHVLTLTHWRTTARAFFPDLLTVDHDTDAPLALIRELVSANPQSRTTVGSVAWRYLQSGNPQIWATRKAERIRNKELNQLTALMLKYGIATTTPRSSCDPDATSPAESAHRAQLNLVDLMGLLAAERHSATERQIDDHTLEVLAELDCQVEAGRQELLRLHSELHTWRGHLRTLAGRCQEPKMHTERDALTEHRRSVAESEIARLSLAAQHQRDVLDDLSRRREGLTQSQSWQEASPGEASSRGTRRQARQQAALALELSVSAELYRQRATAAEQLAAIKDSGAQTGLQPTGGVDPVETCDSDTSTKVSNATTEPGPGECSVATARGVGAAGETVADLADRTELADRSELGVQVEKIVDLCLGADGVPTIAARNEAESEDHQGWHQVRDEVRAWALHLVTVLQAVESKRCLPLLVHDLATPYPDGTEWLDDWPGAVAQYLASRSDCDDKIQLQYVMVMPDGVTSPPNSHED